MIIYKCYRSHFGSRWVTRETPKRYCNAAQYPRTRGSKEGDPSGRAVYYPNAGPDGCVLERYPEETGIWIRQGLHTIHVQLGEIPPGKRSYSPGSLPEAVFAGEEDGEHRRQLAQPVEGGTHKKFFFEIL